MSFLMNPQQIIINSNSRCQIYNNNNINRVMCDADNMTETRNSTQISVSFWFKFKSYLCPCFLPKSEHIIIIKNELALSINQKTSETNNSQNYHLNNDIFSSNQSSNMRRNTKRKNSMEFQENEKKEKLINRNIHLIDREFRQTVNIQLGYNHRMCSIDQYDCPIFNYSQHVLIPVGSNNRRLLVVISRANISIKLALLKKSMAAKKNKSQKIQQKKYGQFQFNKHWDQRYILFEKFDEGIKIDEQSWTVNPPQQVSQYIASKCHGAKIILDAFAGVGGNTIKLAYLNSCVKVIANQANHNKMNFLINNSKVYEVQSHIEISQNDFLKIEKKNIDVVFLQPLLANFHLMMGSHKQITTADFQPKLDKTILKSFKLASNLILLLPPQINLENLCNCINRCAIESKRMRQSCTIKIQKIYCQMKVKYILVCIGNLVQSEVKLNDQLQFIYSKLKKPGDIYFKHKKVLKKIREDYGMLFMYNLVTQSLDRRKQSANLSSNQKKDIFAIDYLYQIIRQRRLIPLQKLLKIINQQEYEYQRQSSHFQSLDYKDASCAISPVMEEEKMDENTYHIQETQLTQSEYSHYSYHQSFDKKSSNPFQKSPNRLRQREGTGNQSIIINRMNTDESKERKDDSPLTPGKKRAKTIHTEEL